MLPESAAFLHYWLQDILYTSWFCRTPDIGYEFETNSGRAFNYFSYGVAVSVVEVDCLTGSHKVKTVFLSVIN